MTYNQVVKEIQEKLQSHPMLHEVMFGSPAIWLYNNQPPSFPSANFEINTGSLNIGREQIFTVNVWLLDKSGVDSEFEQEVTSDMHGIAYDFLQKLRNSLDYSISNTVTWNAISEKFEDYLSGVNFSFDFTVTRSYGNCDSPIND